MHQLIRSRKLLEHSRIAHARLEGGRSNRRSHDDESNLTRSKRKRGDLSRVYRREKKGERRINRVESGMRKGKVTKWKCGSTELVPQRGSIDFSGSRVSATVDDIPGLLFPCLLPARIILYLLVKVAAKWYLDLSNLEKGWLATPRMNYRVYNSVQRHTVPITS